MKFFTYTREVKQKKLDEKGLPIPIIKEKKEGEETDPKKPEAVEFEMETKTFEDFFDLERVIRGLTVEENKIVILLDDGHEVTEQIPKLKDPRKQPTPSNIVYEKQRNWVQSEIILTGDDVERFRKVYKSYTV
jgi:hypothetical protein